MKLAHVKVECLRMIRENNEDFERKKQCFEKKNQCVRGEVKCYYSLTLIQNEGFLTKYIIASQERSSNKL